ncbi:hypothetical protein HY994_02715 [Candidatus Micrarchaeota archaeon]|nr:hypothetical protein [Candidatus Micrarchaeota archaeon]
MMKKTQTLVFVIASLLLLSGFASALIRPDVRITDYSITPALSPGGTSSLVVQLKNVGGDECAYRINVQIAPLSPISLQGIDTHFLDTLCSQDGSKNVTFTLHADQSATLSNNPVTISVAYESEYAAPYVTSQSATVPISGSVQLRAQVTSSTPLDVHPGDTATIGITLDNLGAAKALGLSATLSVPDGSGLDVKANTQTQVVNELLAKKGTILSYTVFVPKRAVPKDYALNLHVAFLDEYGKKQTTDLPVTLAVKAKALFSAQTQDGRLFVGANNVNVHFVLTNTGKVASHKLRVKLIPQFPFSTDGSQRYIETLAPGANDTVDFTLSVDKEAALGHYALQLQAQFEDNEGQSASDMIDVTLTVPQKDLVTAIFMDFWFVWIALIGSVGFLRRGRMQKQAAGKGKTK